MRVVELITSGNIVTVGEDDNLGQAMQAMMSSHVRHLPVLREGRVVGIVSERDVLAAQAEMGNEANRRPVREAMRHPVQLSEPDEDLARVAARMADHKIGCVPVVSDGQLVGMLTRSDILAHEVEQAPPSAVMGLRVRELMKSDPITIAGDDLLLNAAELMVASGVRHLPVVDQRGQLIGMLSDRDMRTAIGDPQRALQDPDVRARVRGLRVWAAMMTPAISVQGESGVAEAVHHLVDRRIGALAVFDDTDRPIGVLSYVDVLKALMSASPAPSAGSARHRS